jgi:hypothetical protein
MFTWKIVGIRKEAAGLWLDVTSNQGSTGSGCVSPYEWEKIVEYLGTESTFESVNSVPNDAISDLVSMATRLPLDDDDDG